jgi:hypothetical protein
MLCNSGPELIPCAALRRFSPLFAEPDLSCLLLIRPESTTSGPPRCLSPRIATELLRIDHFRDATKMVFGGATRCFAGVDSSLYRSQEIFPRA